MNQGTTDLVLEVQFVPSDRIGNPHHINSSKGENATQQDDGKRGNKISHTQDYNNDSVISYATNSSEICQTNMKIESKEFDPTGIAAKDYIPESSSRSYLRLGDKWKDVIIELSRPKIHISVVSSQEFQKAKAGQNILTSDSFDLNRNKTIGKTLPKTAILKNNNKQQVQETSQPEQRTESDMYSSLRIKGIPSRISRQGCLFLLFEKGLKQRVTRSIKLSFFQPLGYRVRNGFRKGHRRRKNSKNYKGKKKTHGKGKKPFRYGK